MIETSSTDEPPALSVVIPTYNRSDTLAETLSRLAGQRIDAPWECVVVDNRSTDDTAAVVGEIGGRFPVSLRLIREEKPGASAARNAGVRAAGAAVVVLVDDDILLEAGQLQRALNDHRARPDAWWVGQVWPLPEHRATPFGAFRAAHSPPSPLTDPVTEVDWYASGFAVIPRRSLLELGGYNEAYPTAGLEDADLAIRARRRGVTVLYDPGLVGLHNDWAGTTLRDFCRREQAHYSTAPLLREYFPDTNHPWAALVSLDSAAVASRSKRTVKALFARPRALTALVAVTERFERVSMPKWLLWMLYRLAVGSSIYAGWARGAAAPVDRRD